MQVDTASLKAMAELVHVFAEEVTIVPKEDCWEIQAIDIQRVGMVRFRMNSSVFGDTYTVGQEFTVDIGKFATVLKDMGATTDITVDTDNGRVVMKSDGTTRRFTLLAQSNTPPNFPSDRLQLEQFAIFDPTELKPKMASLCAISQKIDVALDADGITFSTADDGEDMSVTLGQDKCKVINGNAKAGYPSSYFLNVFKAVPKGMSLQLSYDTDMPVLLAFTGDEYSAEYMIAPQIEQE